MNINPVDVGGAIAGASAVVVEPKPLVETSQIRQPSGGDVTTSHQEMKRIVEKMQEQIDSMNVSLQYTTYGERGEKIAIAVVNKETGELIREIPSKELRNLYEKMSELAGMIFNREI